jgi:hypothetical protein
MGAGRSRVLGIFHNQASCLRQISAVLDGAWLTGRTCLSFEGSGSKTEKLAWMHRDDFIERPLHYQFLTQMPDACEAPENAHSSLGSNSTMNSSFALGFEPRVAHLKIGFFR